MKEIDATLWFENVLSGLDPAYSEPFGSCFDPQILYDHFANRWIMIYAAYDRVNLNQSYLLISTSDDADPLGTWCNFAIPGNTTGSTYNLNFNDYPKLGINNEAFYVSANMINLSSWMFEYVKIRIFEKSQFYSNTCGPISWTDFWDLRDPDNLSQKLNTAATVVPAVTFGDAGAEYLINASPYTLGTFMTLWTITDPLGTPALTAVNIPVVAYEWPPDANQLGGGTPLIDVGGWRVRNAVYRNGHLITAHSVADGTASFSRIHFFELDVTGPTVLTDVSFGATDFWYYYPAITLDASGNGVAVFNRSGTSEYASILYTGILSGVVQEGSVILKSGEDNYVKTFGGMSNRWGDYNGIAVDPSDPNLIWMFAEYAETEVAGTDKWGTWWGEATYTSSGPIYYDSYIVDDDNTGNSIGNDDAIINPGEAIELYVNLVNAGINTATGVNVSISDDSPYTTYTFNTSSDYGDILPLAVATNLDDFDISIDPSTPDGYIIHFTMNITALNGGPWTQYFSIAVDAFPPDIDVTPLSFTFNVAPEGSASDILTISNTAATGSQSLNFHIFDHEVIVELINGRKVPIRLEPSVTDITKVKVNIGDNSNKKENVKSKSSYYPENESVSLIDHLASLQAVELDNSPSSTIKVNLDKKFIPGVEFLSGVLYNNGPLVNSPGTGVGGADESVLQTASLSMTVLGFGNQLSLGNRIADDFTVTDPSGWIVDAFKFYAYQSASTASSTITAVNYQIWDGPPDNPSSTIIYGDDATNRLLTTEWCNIYRVTESTSGSDTQRPIMENTVSAGFYLPPGTYWLDWQTDGTLTSGPWAPPITINGLTATGNALQWVPSAWAPVMDIGQQGFPFLIIGTAGSDCPWLIESPIAGEIPTGSNQLVEIAVNATGISAGTYSANIVITSNDPDENPIEIPVTLNVLGSSVDWAANLMVEDNIFYYRYR